MGFGGLSVLSSLYISIWNLYLYSKPTKVIPFIKLFIPLVVTVIGISLALKVRNYGVYIVITVFSKYVVSSNTHEDASIFPKKKHFTSPLIVISGFVILG